MEFRLWFFSFLIIALFCGTSGAPCGDCCCMASCYCDDSEQEAAINTDDSYSVDQEARSMNLFAEMWHGIGSLFGRWFGNSGTTNQMNLVGYSGPATDSQLPDVQSGTSNGVPTNGDPNVGDPNADNLNLGDSIETSPNTDIAPATDPNIVDPSIDDPNVENPSTADSNNVDQNIADSTTADPNIDGSTVEQPSTQDPPIAELSADVNDLTSTEPSVQRTVRQTAAQQSQTQYEQQPMLTQAGQFAKQLIPQPMWQQPMRQQWPQHQWIQQQWLQQHWPYQQWPQQHWPQQQWQNRGQQPPIRQLHSSYGIPGIYGTQTYVAGYDTHY